MVYESDFYTVRRPYSRPTITSYSVTSPRHYVVTDMPDRRSAEQQYSYSYSANEERRSGAPSRNYSSSNESVLRSSSGGPGSYSYSTERSSRSSGGYPGSYHSSYSSSSSGRLPGGTSYRHYSYRGCRPCLSMRNAIAPPGTHSKVRMSVLLGELNRIQHRHRPHLAYVPTEDYLCSRPLVDFDDEAKHIRAAADKLIRYVHTRVPHETTRPRVVTAYDRYTPEGRYISKYSDVPTNIQCMSYYTEPSRVTIGRGHLACVSYAGGLGYPRRRHLYNDETRDIGDEIKFRSYYSRNVHPSRTDDALLLPTGFASRILLPDRRLLPPSEGRAIVFQSKLIHPASPGLLTGRGKPGNKIERAPKKKTRAQTVEDEVLAESSCPVRATYKEPEVEREVVSEWVRPASPEPEPEPEKTRPASPELEREPEPPKEPTPPPVEDLPKPKKDKKPTKTVHYEPEPVEEPMEVPADVATTEPEKSMELEEEPYLAAAIEEIVADDRAELPEEKAPESTDDALETGPNAQEAAEPQQAETEDACPPMEIETATSQIDEEQPVVSTEEPAEAPIETVPEVIEESIVEKVEEPKEEETLTNANQTPNQEAEEETTVDQVAEKESIAEDESAPVVPDSENEAAHIAEEVAPNESTPNDSQTAEDAFPAVDQDTPTQETSEDQLEETPALETQTSRLQNVPDDEPANDSVEVAPTSPSDDQELPEPTPEEPIVSEEIESPTSETPDPIIEEPLTPTQE